ncbi:TetR family transcriptional regulator [Methylobacterium sp. Leaf465]|uniref:TetR/AcrR family transcriptional regulator n=1 Tax=unclassified Methylobacterium TaxID=2615210 RepID=UPI0006F876C0|nr:MULTISPECIES: TetR/AcrR family transcriptional regulator [unclassified Methylobacterium]KQP62609.1 TetR family transcriptional regulator [Methylobacterium sp. Leaf111]KQT76701.1 TetR family transcriptional regulator [Methylobacterium sp. Leaf465]KQU33302.1 TetR family transcriptional regulator [Methylobacterium sp. Leaf94]
MMKARTRREDRPVVILDAAERLIRRMGTRTLTIDAVAAEASLSKGGVLHHYASKDALISALAERKLREIRESVAAHEVEQGPGPAALPLALIAHARQVYADEDGFPRALLLASAENPEAFAGFNAFLKQRLAQMEDVACCPGAGAMLTFATLGLLLSRTLGFHCLEGAELEKLFDAMESAARSLPKPIPA